MLEWLKRHAWKACIRQKRIPGSNPGLSAYYYDGEYLSKGYSPSSFLFLHAAQINAKRSCNGILANVRHSSVPLVLSSR